MKWRSGSQNNTIRHKLMSVYLKCHCYGLINNLYALNVPNYWSHSTHISFLHERVAVRINDRNNRIRDTAPQPLLRLDPDGFAWFRSLNESYSSFKKLSRSPVSLYTLTYLFTRPLPFQSRIPLICLVRKFPYNQHVVYVQHRSLLTIWSLR
jgi:hypothetical protein